MRVREARVARYLGLCPHRTEPIKTGKPGESKRCMGERLCTGRCHPAAGQTSFAPMVSCRSNAGSLSERQSPLGCSMVLREEGLRPLKGPLRYSFSREKGPSRNCLGGAMVYLSRLQQHKYTRNVILACVWQLPQVCTAHQMNVNASQE